MCIDRRDFLRASAGLAGAAMMPSFAFADTGEVEAIQQQQDTQKTKEQLKPKEQTKVKDKPKVDKPKL